MQRLWRRRRPAAAARRRHAAPRPRNAGARLAHGGPSLRDDPEQGLPGPRHAGQPSSPGPGVSVFARARPGPRAPDPRRGDARHSRRCGDHGRFGGCGVSAPPGHWILLFSLIVVGIFAARGMYGPRLHFEMLEDVRVVVVATSLAAMGVLGPGDVRQPPDLAAQTIRMWAFAAAYLAAGRIALHWSRARAHRQGEGPAPDAHHRSRQGRATDSEATARPSGDRPQADRVPGQGPRWPRKPTRADAGPGGQLGPRPGRCPARRPAGDHQPSRAPHEVLLRLVARCEELGLQVAFVPRLYEKITSKLTVEHLAAFHHLDAACEPQGCSVRGQVRGRPRSCGPRCSWSCFPSRRWLRRWRPSDDRSSSASFAGPRRANIRDAQVSIHARHFARRRRVGCRLGRRAARRRQGRAVDRRGSPYPVGTLLPPVSIDELPQLLNVAQGRDEPRWAAPGARRCRALRAEHLSLHRQASRQVRDHRLGPGARPPREDLARQTGSSGTTTTSRTGRYGSTSRFSCLTFLAGVRSLSARRIAPWPGV